MKLLIIMEFSSSLCYCISLRAKYSPRYFVVSTIKPRYSLKVMSKFHIHIKFQN